MKIEKIQEQQEQISLKMVKLEKREKMLKEKERKIRTKKLIQTGELISKAEIEHLDPEALLGALLEIREQSKDEKAVKGWSAKGKAAMTRDRNENAQQLILVFESEPSPIDKSTLKGLKFKWNPFRKEWYGFGKREEIEPIFKAQGSQVKFVNF